MDSFVKNFINKNNNPTDDDEPKVTAKFSNYFNAENHETVVRCLICRTLCKTSGNSTNMASHLKNHHSNLYKKLMINAFIMGIIVKVYIENNDEEIDIVTLNSEDKKSSSVTITASVIKDYLNKLGRSEDLPGRRDDRIISKKSNYGTNVTANNGNKDERKLLDDSPVPALEEDSTAKSNLNSDGIQSDSVMCSHSGIHATSFTPDNDCSREKVAENANDNDVISQNSNSNIQLNDVQNYIRVNGDDRSGSCVNGKDNLPTADTDPPGKVVNEQLPLSGDILEDTDLSMCIDNSPSENPDLEDTNIGVSDGIQLPIINGIVDTPQFAVTRSNESDCDNCYTNFDLKNNGENGSKNDESSSSREERMESEIGAENVIASLKNVSYDVDDFLNMVNNTPTQRNQLRLSSFPSFLDEFSNSPEIYSEEINEDEGELEEFFVIEKIAASRFNEETKVLEFLLKAQKCVSRKEPWTPIRTNITDLTITHPKCLYIQCPKSFKSQRRRLNEKFDQYVQFLDIESGFMYNVPSETIPNCPSVIDMPNDFSSDLTSDVVVDPQKSLNDARLIEPCVDDNKNITPVKLLKNGEVSNVSDIGLPSSHFYISDIVPGLDDQLVEFVENNPTPSTNAISETEMSKKPSNMSSLDRARKKHRNDNKRLQCPHCPYRTVSTNALENHLRRHTKEFLKCGWCPKRYLTSAGLKNHERTHRNGQLSLIENVNTGVIGSCAEMEEKSFLEINQVKSPFDKDSSTNVERTQPPVIPNGAMVSTVGALDSTLLNDYDVKCKMKQISKMRMKNPRGRPKRPKIEPDNAEIIDLCDDDVNPSESIVAKEIPTNTAVSKTEVLQKCLADTVNAIENSDLISDGTETASNFQELDLKNPNENDCNVCHQSFKTAADLLNHNEHLHKYPIVLLKRLSIY